MTESAFSTARGTEISERSTELVLPGEAAPSGSVVKSPLNPLTESTFRLSSNGAPARERKNGVNQSDRPHRPEFGPAFEKRSSATQDVQTRKATLAAEERGLPLPGDRGREAASTPKARPSFWRRIALGRRKAKSNSPPADDPGADRQLAPAMGTAAGTPAPQGIESLERRIVEPMLQALVSVESKLERSHIDLLGRSDQIEQRLTQLWDIEEQLGVLSELQESLLQISEQQRRLESSLVVQNRTLRWLIATMLFALAAGSFVVAAVLQ
jgi:hypothetical protein